MVDCSQLAITFIIQILESITPSSPMFFVFGLMIVAGAAEIFIALITLGKRKRKG
jgi:hypothetical protein